jgi:histone-lysine N-methyltransferase SETMAR
MSQERVGFIIQQLGYRKICARWVPKMLTQENKKIRVECSQKLLNRYHQEGEQFLLKIVTGDETWVHHYDPEEKRQSMEYRLSLLPSSKSSRFSLLQERLCLRYFGMKIKFI